MSDYFLRSGISETGESITLTIPWEHEVSELRCLCVVDDKAYQEQRVLNAGEITGEGGTYTIAYPFSVAGLRWKAYLWRDTTVTGTAEYDGSRIPVEAIVSKLNELNSKVDETKVALERALMTPEDMDGKMFTPSQRARAGELLGFDDDGYLVTGSKIPMVNEIFDIGEDVAEKHKAVLASLKAVEGGVIKMENALDLIKGDIAEVQNIFSDVKTAYGLIQEVVSNLDEIEANMDAIIEAESSATAAKDAIEALLNEAREEGVILNVGQATSLMTGTVKLASDTALTEGLYAGLQLNENGQAGIPAATTSAYGAVKLGSSEVLDDLYAGIGVSSSGELRVASAALNKYGVVKLGSRYPVTHKEGYHVGIGISEVYGKRGQLMFNLRETYEDGSPGALVHEKKGATADEGFQTYVKIATDTTYGVIKTNLITALNATVNRLSSKVSEFGRTVEQIADSVAALEEKYASFNPPDWLIVTDDTDGEVFSVKPEAAAATVNLKLNWAFIPGKITVESDSAWVHVDNTEDAWKTGDLVVSFEENTAAESRGATLFIAYGNPVAMNNLKQISIVQKGINANVSVEGDAVFESGDVAVLEQETESEQ